MSNKDTAEVSENKPQLKLFLPKELLECVPRCGLLPKERLRWNTNEEIASYLITFEKHEEWLSCSPKTRPQNGSMILYNRKKVKYRKDGYCWKKRKDGKTTREDHMKLKVQGMECLYGCYVHSSIVPTFHRRCYWLLQNPDIVLVHYLNVPAMEDCGKICGPILCSINSDRKEWLKWSKEELINQLKPMFHGIKWTCSNGNGTTEFSIEQLVHQILENHQAKPQLRTHACLCNSPRGTPGHLPHKFGNTKHRIISLKVEVRPCPYPALTEVQNIDAKTEPDTKEGRLGKSVAQGSGGGNEISSSSSSETPDSAHSSPAAYGERELSSVGLTGSSMPVGSVACTLPRNAVIVMTSLAPEKPLTLTPSQHLIVPEAGSTALTPGGPELALAPASGLALLPSPGLLLSQNLEASMDTADSPTACFDPDSFLNSPRRGQTYGGGASFSPAPAGEPPPQSESKIPEHAGLFSSTLLPPRLEKPDHGTPKPFLYGPPLPSGGPRNPFFIQDDEEGGRGQGIESRFQQQEEEGGNSVKEELQPPAGPCKPGVPERETPMDTSSHSTSDRGAADTSAAAASGMHDLYSAIQNELGPASSPAAAPVAAPTAINLHIGNFNITFDSQFPDIISDLLPEEEEEGRGADDNFCEVQSQPDISPHASFPLPVAGFSESATQAVPETAPPAPPLVCITDFSPEWSYPEGGVKVLITGPWQEDTEQYSCIFDQISVPASLIQSGVLRCYCPAHESGLVTLQVAKDNRIISSSVLFEYRARNFMSLPSTQLDWLSLDDNQFRMSILERLEQMEKRVAEMTALSQQQQQQQGGAGDSLHIQASGDSFEARIVAVCEKMMSRPCWLRSERLVHDIGFRGMTLLHLAAAQGYAKLVETLIKWRTVNAQSLNLELEVDPLNVDHFSCTPLMWACALGHVEAAVLLYRWNRRALAIPDSLGRLPLGVARSRGHVKLATHLEELQRQDQAQGELLTGEDLFPEAELSERDWQELVRGPPEPRRIPSSLASSPDTGLSSSSSISSPSELSEGPVSVTSAYSSSSALRESPHRSPDRRTGQDVNMDTSEGQRALNCGPREPLFFMDYEPVPTDSRDYSCCSTRDSSEDEILSYSKSTESENYLSTMDVLQVDMITLAEQIIEATPERIKQEDFSCMETPLKERQGNLALSKTMTWLASYLENIDPLPSLSQRRDSCRAACALVCLAEQARSVPSEPPKGPGRNPQDPAGYGARNKKATKRTSETVKLKLMRSVCTEPLTPPSAHTCLSPLQSPLGDIAFDKFDPPSAANWSEFLNASANGKMESEFALLTLSDHEQRELYEAAKIIQTAFRRYKGRRLKEQQEVAAAVIQRCYRKYKQYALYKKMTQAAILIQSKFRSYYEQKKFQQSRRAAVLIQQYYRSYKGCEKLKQGHRAGATMQQKIKGSFLTKKQDQAARKIMRFLRRCRHRMKELKQSKELEGPQKRGYTT
ncbi:calmodulin-binding transcription activator 2 isoform X2 [Rhinatrema bivittatum]|uniref:calmodulin-binding transcription activator 2 isoform X2 n=1 Tax=Rhinatrema bivittatum TaxID=194408 RepID=UPI001125F42E|nr:calmodulin-binding transcription activator 2 isoform X2 [Rhinatrema bivittatum]